VLSILPKSSENRNGFSFPLLGSGGTTILNLPRELVVVRYRLRVGIMNETGFALRGVPVSKSTRKPWIEYSPRATILPGSGTDAYRQSSLQPPISPSPYTHTPLACLIQDATDNEPGSRWIRFCFAITTHLS